jgi:hypothetical protein
MLQAMKVHAPQISLQFADVLRAADRVFERWRYAFDGTAGSAYGLPEIEQAVRERITVLQHGAA